MAKQVRNDYDSILEIVVSTKLSGKVVRKIDQMAIKTMRSRAATVRWLLTEAAERMTEAESGGGVGKALAPESVPAAAADAVAADAVAASSPCVFCVDGDHKYCLHGDKDPNTGLVVNCDCRACRGKAGICEACGNNCHDLCLGCSCEVGEHARRV